MFEIFNRITHNGGCMNKKKNFEEERNAVLAKMPKKLKDICIEIEGRACKPHFWGFVYDLSKTLSKTEFRKVMKFVIG